MQISELLYKMYEALQPISILTSETNEIDIVEINNMEVEVSSLPANVAKYDIADFGNGIVRVVLDFDDTYGASTITINKPLPDDFAETSFDLIYGGMLPKSVIYIGDGPQRKTQINLFCLNESESSNGLGIEYGSRMNTIIATVMIKQQYSNSDKDNFDDDYLTFLALKEQVIEILWREIGGCWKPMFGNIRYAFASDNISDGKQANFFASTLTFTYEDIR
jgi:hypothetical protein